MLSAKVALGIVPEFTVPPAGIVKALKPWLYVIKGNPLLENAPVIFKIVTL